MISAWSQFSLRHGGRRHGQAAGLGRIVEPHPTRSAARTAEAERRSAARQRPRVFDRDTFHSEDRHPVGVPSAGDGLRQRHDVLASATRLACGRRVGRHASRPARTAQRRGRDRLVARDRRQRHDARGRGGEKTGPNPTDRRKPGSKHHLLVEAKGLPLVATITGANRPDGEQQIPMIDAIPPLAGKVGRPRRKPDCVQGDRAYHSRARVAALRERGIAPVLAKRGAPHGSGLGKTRWPVERTLSWLHQFRRLRIRYDRRADIHEAFLKLGCALICWRRYIAGYC